MKRRRIFKIAALVIGVPLLLLAIVLLYLNFADLSGWRDTVAGLASDAIGRELKINGEFQPEIGFTTRVVATDITLANADWSNDPQMVSVDRLAGEIDLLSIFFGPITIGDAEIDGARVLFEVDGDGRFNWALGDGKPSESGGGEFEMVIGHALVKDLQLVYAAPDKRPLKAELSKLEITDDGTGMLDLDLAGSLDGSAVAISGRLGTFIGLINANRVEHDLEGRFADAEFGLRGTIGNLGSLAGVEGGVTVSGPELSHITDSFGLDPVIEGPFTAQASVRPSGKNSDFDIEAAAGGISARVTGVVDSLTEAKFLDATVTASGPSIRTVGAFTGVADLPDEEFSVSGGVRWEGFPVTFKQVEITVGDNTLSANGVLGAPPQMLGTNFTIQSEGPNLSSLGGLAGIDLPNDSFSVSGRVLRVEDGLEIDHVEAHVGRTTLKVDGKVGDPPDYAGTTLTIHAEGPNIAHFNDLIGIGLPAQPFIIDGRLAQGNNAITLEGVSARLGGASLRVDGFLKTAKGLTGTSLRIEAKGPDAAQLSTLIGLNDLPAEAWSVEGGVAVLDSGLRLDGVSAAVGSLEAHGDGRLSTRKGLVGTDLQLRGRDPDLSHGISIFGVNGFPRVAATVEGRLRVEAGGYRLDGATGTTGDIDVAVDGLIGRSHLDGTLGNVSVHGPRLSSLGMYFNQSGLPTAPFSVSGSVRVAEGAYEIDNVAAAIADNRITASGTIFPTNGLQGSSLAIDLSGPDLGRAGALAKDLVEIPEFPSEPFSLETQISVDEDGYLIRGLEATLAGSKTAIDGRVGPPPEFVGTDLRVDAGGPNASLFLAVTGVSFPAAPFRIEGRVQRTGSGFNFDRLALRLADYRVDLHGSLGEPPRLEGTDLSLGASGPDFVLIRELSGWDRFPNEPFEVSGRFRGTPERFSTHDLEVSVGKSDIKGSLEIDIRGKPSVTARITSRHLDLAPYFEDDPTQESESADGEDAPVAPAKKKVISDRPIDFGPLQKADADVSITIGTLQLPVKVFRTVDFGARLADGRLEVYRFRMVGQREGTGSATLLLEPAGDAYRLETMWDLNALRLDLPGLDPTEPLAQPPIDLDLNLSAQGLSLREFARSSNGSFQVVVGKGVMENQILDLITADILVTLLNAFNPFAKDDVTAELQCAVALVTFNDGIATLAPMAVQSDKMTMLGGGKVDLSTEKLNFDWITKPRKGIGLSTSMLTNPYIKVGGTLGNPAIELKGMEAMAQTGAAVATLGISLVAQGMLDRITAEKKVCKKAHKDVEKIRQQN